MTTTTLNHRPAPFIAAAAAVVALAAGGLAFAVSHDSSQPSAPEQGSQTSVQHQAPRAHHFHPTTSGGHVMIGQ
jgi:hypothetical protein